MWVVADDVYAFRFYTLLFKKCCRLGWLLHFGSDAHALQGVNTGNVIIKLVN